MLDRFLLLKTCILKASIDLNLTLNLTIEEYTVLNAIVSALQPIKLGIEKLGRQNATLLAAEGVLVFILEELLKNKNFFSSKLLECVKKRVV
jgi:hypothetical protein